LKTKPAKPLLVGERQGQPTAARASQPFTTAWTISTTAMVAIAK
jgi:hypothetical protein